MLSLQEGRKAEESTLRISKINRGGKKAKDHMVSVSAWFSFLDVKLGLCICHISDSDAFESGILYTLFLCVFKYW